MGTSTLNFTPVSGYIGRCQGLLGNRMQCTKAGEFDGVDNSVNPPSALGQYCKMHMVYMQAGIMATPVQTIANTGTVQVLPIADSDVQAVPVDSDDSQNNAEPAAQPPVTGDSNGNSTNTTTPTPAG